jgi:hypothetical protein
MSAGVERRHRDESFALPSELLLHRPTSDGYESAKRLWETSHHQILTIAEATELGCRFLSIPVSGLY